MKKADVQIGETYRAQIEPGITILVRIVAEDWAGKGWEAVALNYRRSYPGAVGQIPA